MKNTCPINDQFKNFQKYTPRQTLARFLVQHELFKLQLPVKGSIVECGVHHGGGLLAWGKLSSIFEPYNYHRQIIGFDTFEGFPSINELDKESSVNKNVKVGDFSLNYNVFEELKECISDFDDNRFLNHIEKIKLCKGDAILTIPKFMEENKHLIISMLFLDFDIYEPTMIALKHFLPRIPKGGVIAFDELNNPYWPGETIAFLKSMSISSSKLRIFPYEPNISYIVLD